MEGKLQLITLEPCFLKIINPITYNMRATFGDCDGIQFLCPVCFKNNKGRCGTHSIICWKPGVAQDVFPIPGRWAFEGTGFHDLTLVAGSSSILLTGKDGCKAHFFIRNGFIEF